MNEQAFFVLYTIAEPSITKWTDFKNMPTHSISSYFELWKNTNSPNIDGTNYLRKSIF
jgi:hypothetical protein